MRSFIRWAGSKRLLVPKLQSLWSYDFRRYVEPFAGSGSLFFAIEPESALLGDLNHELVGALRAVKRDVYRVIECLRRMPRGKRAYYKIRSLQPSQLSDMEAAARFVYLNRFCFNGLFRTNSRGEFNVPYCPWGVGVDIDYDAIVRCSKLLQRAQLSTGDFEQTLSYVEANDFVYLDPPYVVSNRRLFTEYLPGSFQELDLIRLERCLQSLSKRKSFFVVSYADCKQARQILSSWNCKRVRVRRHIAGFTGHRRTYFELLATNMDLDIKND